MKNRSPYLWSTIEWISTWYDHFRHVYEFVKTLYKAIDTQFIDYDMRDREVIDENNFDVREKEFSEMIKILWEVKHNIKLSITAKNTYPNFYSSTSFQRELLEVLEHENTHYSYLNPNYNNIQYNNGTYDNYKQTNILLSHVEKIQQDINQDIKRYQSLPVEILDGMIQNKYQTIIKRIDLLHQYKTDDILVYNTTFTSVGNEYYKIEEEFVHLLYDIRLLLKNSESKIFEQLVQNDPSFWIARSTLQSLVSSQ